MTTNSNPEAGNHAYSEAELKAFRRARRSRDARFDGRFFVGVHSTGIYCRPICPAPTAKERNVRYYASAAAAAVDGLRPCLRCRPEAAPGTPAWLGTATTVRRALRLIDEGALDDGDVERLATRLGVGERHLRRLFFKYLGATPIQVATTRRLHFARRLLIETDLKVTDVAFAAGFGSVRRFNSAFKLAYDTTPSSLRRGGGEATDEGMTLRLSYRPPYDFPRLLSYLEARAIPGVEVVSTTYRRTIRLENAPDLAAAAWLEVADARGDALSLTLHGCPPTSILEVVRSVRRLFDLDADPAEIRSAFAGDPLLGPMVDADPGVRVPGAVDRFEAAIRVILGQQVTVRGATTLTGDLVRLCGSEVETGAEGLQMRFPSPSALAGTALEALGIPRARIRALQLFAAEVAAGNIDLSSVENSEEVMRQTLQIPGLGPWTAQVVALRSVHDPDVFPSSDLGLRKAFTTMLGEKPSFRKIDDMAKAWSPWRSYAALLIWRTEVAHRPG